MPSAADVARCDHCHARIIWTVTAANRHLAVNAEPDDAGNTAVYTDATGRIRSRAITTDRPATDHIEWRAMPHPATCTNPPPRSPRRAPRTVRRPSAWRPR